METRIGTAPAPPRRRRILLTVAGLVLLALLALAGWLFKVSFDQRAFSRHVHELAAEEEAARVRDGENAAPLYRAALALYVPRPESQTAPYSPEDNAAYLAANDRFLRAIRAAAQLPRCDFDFPLSAPGPDERELVPVEQLSVRSIALLVAMHRHAAQGDPAEALSAFRDYLAVARHLASGGDLQMVQATAESIGGMHMQAVLYACDPSDEQLLGLLRDLDTHRAKRSRPGPAVHRIMIRSLLLWDLFARGDPAASGILNQSPGLGRTLEHWYYKHTGQLLDLSRRTEACLTAESRAMEEPWPRPLEAFPALIAEHQQGLSTGFAVGFTMMMNEFSNMVTEEAKAEACLSLLEAAVRCRLFRHRHGGYPAALEELRRDLPASATEPRDPFSGGPLKYRRTEEGCLLWSVGPDRRDDAGTPPPKYHKETSEEMWAALIRRGKGEPDPGYDLVFDLKK